MRMLFPAPRRKWPLRSHARDIGAPGDLFVDEIDSDADCGHVRPDGRGEPATEAFEGQRGRLLGRLGACPFFHIRSSETSRALIKAMVGPVERLRIVLLDDADKYIHDEEIAFGDAHSLSADFRSIFAIAFTHDASAIALVHNHPSGNCEPSSSDIEATRTISALASILGFRLVDHIVIGGSAAHSMKTGARLS